MIINGMRIRNKNCTHASSRDFRNCRSSGTTNNYIVPSISSCHVSNKLHYFSLNTITCVRFGNCGYITAYNQQIALHPDGKNISVMDKTCLCTHMRNYNCWTCGSSTYRLKDTTRQNADGSYQTLSAEHIFRDYQYSVDNQILLPSAA